MLYQGVVFAELTRCSRLASPTGAESVLPARKGTYKEGNRKASQFVGKIKRRTAKVRQLGGLEGRSINAITKWFHLGGRSVTLSSAEKFVGKLGEARSVVNALAGKSESVQDKSPNRPPKNETAY